MNRLQITIGQIDNGFIINRNIVDRDTNKQLEPTQVVFCQDLEATQIYLAQVWPRDRKISSLND